MDTKTNIKTCKYKRDELSFDSDEYKFVKNFYETNTSTQGFSPVFRQLIATGNFKVYKISENYPTEKIDEKRNNLMLFHGTNEKNVDGILNKGFINSKRGRFGKGVYMTEVSSVASFHSLKKTSSDTNRSICNRCIFVNEVLESEKLKTLKYSPLDRIRLVGSKPGHKFEKHVVNDRKIASEQYKMMFTVGNAGRSQMIGIFNKVTRLNLRQMYLFVTLQDVFLADKSLVIPRYLIVIVSDE